ncbi:MAG: hypothetical protein KIT83_14090 [Bryobacterales bacterium]|nr:hypothetical protein [Bryobacterales bacterium]
MHFVITRLGVVLLVLCLPLSAGRLANTGIAYKQFARILDASANDPNKQDAALQFLASIALNKPGETTAMAYAKEIIRADPFDTPFYKENTVRREAFYAIGRLGTPAALGFLQGITPSQFRDEDREYLWPAAQIALSDARQMQLPNLHERTRYLASLLARTGDDGTNGQVTGWATEQLCNLGALDLLPEVAAAYKRRSSAKAAEYAEYCRERMWVVVSHPDRPTALASALTVENAANNSRLVYWAIHELKKYRQPSATARVDAYIQELIALPRSSPYRKAAMEKIVIYEMNMLQYLRVK